MTEEVEVEEAAEVEEVEEPQESQESQPPASRGRPKGSADASMRKRRTAAEVAQDKITLAQAKVDALKLQIEAKAAAKAASRTKQWRKQKPQSLLRHQIQNLQSLAPLRNERRFEYKNPRHLRRRRKHHTDAPVPRVAKDCCINLGFGSSSKWRPNTICTVYVFGRRTGSRLSP